MFNFDEKYLYPMGKPCTPHGEAPFHPHDGGGCFPPETPAFTITEDMKHTIRQMNETIRHLVEFEKKIQSKYEETMKVLTSDNVLFKNTFASAHTMFVQEVKNEVNEFEGNLDASFEVFKTAIEGDYKALLETCHTLMSGCEESLKQMVNANNANNTATFNSYVVTLNTRINEAERELRNAYSSFTLSTNESLTAWKNAIESRLDDGLTAEVERILADVAFDEVIGESVTAFKRDLNYVTPEQFGAVGNGSKDDSAAIASAIEYASTHNIRRVVFRGMYRVDTPITLSNYRQDKTHKPVSLECSDGMQYTNCIIGNTGREVFKLENTHHMVLALNIVSSTYEHTMFVNPIPENERNGSTIGYIVTRGTIEPSAHTAEFSGAIYLHHDMSVNDGYGTVAIYNDTCEMVNYRDCWYVADTPIIITTRDMLGITENPYNESCKDHYFVGRNVLISRGNVCLLIDGAIGVHGTIYGNGEGSGDNTTFLRVPTHMQNFDLTIDVEQTRHAVDGKGCLSYGTLRLSSAGLIKGITDISLNSVNVYDNMYFTGNNNVILEITNGENVMGCNIYTQYANTDKPRKIVNNYILANTNVYPANATTTGTVIITKGSGSIMTLATIYEGNMDGYGRNIDGRMVGWSYAKPTGDAKTGSLFINRSDIMETQDGQPAFWLKRGTEYVPLVQVGYRRIQETALATTTPRFVGEFIIDDNDKLRMGYALTAGAWTV